MAFAEADKIIMRETAGPGLRLNLVRLQGFLGCFLTCSAPPGNGKRFMLRATVILPNNNEDHLGARLISLLDGDILPLPTMSDLERDKQRIAFAVCDATGVTLEEWARMDKPSREVCLERTLTELTKPVTVWRHGERSYSVDGCDPVVVTAGVAIILDAFEKARAALDTRTLEEKVSNVARVISQIESKFPRAVRRPSKKGEGYYIRVQPATVK